MKDGRSTSSPHEEPPRPRTIPADFIYCPETEAYYPPGEPSNFNVDEWLRELNEYCKKEDRPRGLISVDQLRAAGALDVPAAWRKSLGGAEDGRDLYSGLVEDDEPDSEEQSPLDDSD